MSDLRRAVLGRPPPRKPGPETKMSRGRFNDFTPIHWSGVFAEQVFTKIEDETGAETGNYCAYLRYKQSEAKAFAATEPVIVFLHGCGHSGLTWGETVLEADQYMTDVQFVAIDLRGHGLTKTKDDYKLSFNVLISDLLQVLNKTELDTHPLVLVGHSMGGALAIEMAEHIEQKNLYMKVLALFIIDIVEGSAVDALPSMKPIIKSRPTGFESIEKAIEWTLKTGQVRSQCSARLSVPGQLQESKSSSQKENDGANSVTESANSSSAAEFKIPSTGDAIIEEDEAESEDPSASTSNVVIPKLELQPPVAHKFTWRIDVMKTEPYWLGWFTGMSKKFLNIECPKYLLLANVDRLDKELTIAQMQGKFQMSCIHDVGHAVQEDKPEQVGMELATFLIRHRIAKSRAGSKTLVFPGVI